MSQPNINLPYFDRLLEDLKQGNSAVQQAYGKHVHWGYWGNPATADGSVADFAQATEEMTRRICDLARIQDGMRVLDVGCGFGGTIAHLNERFSNLELVGLNIDPRQIARAKEQVEPHNNNQIEFVVADACELPFSENSFDVVLAIQSIVHFSSRLRFFEEVKQVLPSNGRLVLSDFIPLPWIVPFIKTINSFVGKSFGPVDITSTLADYHQLSQTTGLTPYLEEDITTNTLPTYSVLKKLQRQRDLKRLERISSLSSQLSHWQLIHYYILGFENK